MCFSLGMPAMPVDTHIYRVSQRLRLIGPKVSADKAHDILEPMVSEEDVFAFHVYLIQTWQAGVQGAATAMRRLRAGVGLSVEGGRWATRLPSGGGSARLKPGDRAGSFGYFPIALLSFALSLSKGRPFMVRQAHHERTTLKLHHERTTLKLHHERTTLKLHHERTTLKLHHERTTLKLHHERTTLKVTTNVIG